MSRFIIKVAKSFNSSALHALRFFITYGCVHLATKIAILAPIYRGRLLSQGRNVQPMYLLSQSSNIAETRLCQGRETGGQMQAMHHGTFQMTHKSKSLIFKQAWRSAAPPAPTPPSFPMPGTFYCLPARPPTRAAQFTWRDVSTWSTVGQWS